MEKRPQNSNFIKIGSNDFDQILQNVTLRYPNKIYCSLPKML